MTDVRIDEKGTIWVGRGAVMLYGPFTEDERDSLRRRILMALKYEHVPDAPPPSTCRAPHCDRPHDSIGLCSAHYQRVQVPVGEMKR
jgi:hypothetical protein